MFLLQNIFQLVELILTGEEKSRKEREDIGCTTKAPADSKQEDKVMTVLGFLWRFRPVQDQQDNPVKYRQREGVVLSELASIF